MSIKRGIKKGNKTGFWKEEHCEYCDGSIVEKTIDLPRKIGKGYVLIKNVPAGVCKGCGTRYFSANVLKTIEETIRRRRKADGEICIKVYSL